MLFFLIIFVIVVADWHLKKYMEQKLEDDKDYPPGTDAKVYFRKYHNTGAAFNFLKESPKGMRLLHGCILAYVFLLMLKERKPASRLGLALLSGGGLSNYLDRRKQGYVMDYVSFRFGPGWFRKLVFNVSDFCVFLGAALVCCGRLRRR